MPLVTTAQLNTDAVAGGTGVGAFNVVLLEHAEAFVRAAETVGRPVVLQISENTVRYHGALEPLGVATLALARAASTPTAVHLDHATSSELVHNALRLGFTSVMFDGSRLPYEANVQTTAQAAADCHADGVSIEAELGEIGGKDGVHAPGARTDPDNARRFVDATGVDALAVAVGTSHAMTTRDAVLDFELIATLRAAVDVPLILHGSSGVPDEHLARAVRAGITKINISTRLNASFTAAVRNTLSSDRHVVDPRPYVTAGRDALVAEAEHLLRLIAG